MSDIKPFYVEFKWEGRIDYDEYTVVWIPESEGLSGNFNGATEQLEMVGGHPSWITYYHACDENWDYEIEPDSFGNGALTIEEMDGVTGIFCGAVNRFLFATDDELMIEKMKWHESCEIEIATYGERGNLVSQTVECPSCGVVIYTYEDMEFWS